MICIAGSQGAKLLGSGEFQLLKSVSWSRATVRNSRSRALGTLPGGCRGAAVLMSGSERKKMMSCEKYDFKRMLRSPSDITSFRAVQRQTGVWFAAVC